MVIIQAWLALSLAAIWVRFRNIMCHHPDVNDGTWQQVFWNGAFSDVIYAVFFAWIIYLVHACLQRRHAKISLVICAGIIIGYMACLAANNLFITANGSNLDFTMADQAWDQSFILGTVFTVAYAYEFLHIGGILLLAYMFAYGFSFWILNGLVTVGFLSLMMHFILHHSTPMMAASWMQTSLFQDAYTDLMTRRRIHSKIVNVDAYFQKDLDAPLRVTLPNAKKPPNILMIVLESVGENHVNDGWMPYLQSLREESLYYNNYMIAGQVTINGLYAMLCGDFPALLNPKIGAVKAWKIDDHGEQHFCLPSFLGKHGYQTIFMQSGDLKFQSQKGFNDHIGFQESYGKNELLPIAKNENAWGKNDMELYYYVYDTVLDLNQQGYPWFMTVMTLSTHYPRVVPKDYLKQHPENGEKENAYRFADMALESLMLALEDSGTMNNTLVIITSDEVRHFGDDTVAGELSRNNGVLYALLPNEEKAQIDQPFSQTDLFLSLADYVQLSTNDITIGRSIFRTYDSFRPQFMMHFFSKKIWVIPEENRLISCHETYLNCAMFRASDETSKLPLFDKEWAETPWQESWKDLIYNISDYNDVMLPAVLE